jgi:hypothetical protein
VTNPEEPTAPPAFLSEDGLLIWVDGTWFTLTPEVPLSPDRQWVLINRSWRRVEQMPRKTRTENPPPATVAARTPIGLPKASRVAQAGERRLAMARLGAPLRYHRRAIGVGTAAVAAVVVIAMLGSAVLNSGSSPTVKRPQAQAQVRAVAEPTQSAEPTLSLSGSVTVMAPYGEVTNGKCAASTVSRYYPARGSSMDYQDPAPSRYVDVTAGSSFTVKDASGAIIATGQLDVGTLTHRYAEVSPGYGADAGSDLPKTAVSDDNNGFCSYAFSTTDLPASNFYQLQFGTEAPISLSKADLQASSGHYEASFGDATDAQRETDNFYENLCLSAIGGGGNCDAPTPAASPSQAGA